jgi:phage baseplate assembly protein W
MAQNRAFAVEDGNLASSSLISTRNVDYLDIDLTFAKKPNGDIYKKRDAAAVKQAVKNLVQTNFYEKPFQPFFGTDVRAMLFELADEDTEDDVRSNIIRAIEKYEKRAQILDLVVKSTPDANDLAVTLTFRILNTEEVVTFSTTLSRLR